MSLKPPNSPTASVPTVVGSTATVTNSIGERLMRAMDNQDRDTQILVIGDSTSSYSSSSDSYKWPYVLLRWLAARYPAYTISHSAWTGTFFQDTGTIQTGTGSKSLRLYNASWGGVGTRFHQAQNMGFMLAYDLPDGVGTGGPDLVFISHGHNDGTGESANPFWRDDLLALTESVTNFSGGVEVVLIAQNPRVNSTDYQRALQHETMKVAQMRGFGFINIWKTFIDASPSSGVILEPNPGALMFSDGIHPNTNGQNLWGGKVISLMSTSPGALPSQQASSFAVPVVNRLANGDFTSFSSPPTLPSWTATNATLTKDVTNFESSSGWSVNIAAATAAAAYISQSIPGYKDLVGKWVTLSARVRVPADGGASTVGRVSIVEGGGSQAGETMSVANRNGEGAFIWLTVSRRIRHDATSITARIYATANNESRNVSVDRAILSGGMLPRDIR